MIPVLIISMVSVLACSPVSSDVLYPDTIFYDYVISVNESPDSVFSGDQISLLAKINRLDSRFFRPGVQLKVPRKFDDFDWMPLPKERSNLDGLAKVVVVDLNLQFLGAYEYGHLVFWSPISSGNPKIRNGKETPNGSFKILFKDANHRSYGFGVSMPYAMNFHGGFYIHVGDLPGYPASHGCVRMLYVEAKKLYQWAGIGTRVIIENKYTREYLKE
ncbi:MAG: L,D-transpeptidase [Patescibacteria group bacterium]